MNAIEQKLANVADSLIDALGAAVSEKNPAYDSIIAIGTGLIDNLNAQINPTAAPAATQIASAATALGATVASAPAAAETLGSSAATATQKASAVGILVQDAESVFASIRNLF